MTRKNKLTQEPIVPFTGEKPPITVTELPDGTLRVYNVQKAARWLGIKQQTLSRIIRRFHHRANPMFTTFINNAKLTRKYYPELFAGENAPLFDGE